MIQTLFGSVEQEPSLLEKLKSGVQKTRAGLVNALEDALQGKKEIDAGLLDELEARSSRPISACAPPKRSWSASASAWSATSWPTPPN
jgi:hypothetical protein